MAQNKLAIKNLCAAILDFCEQNSLEFPKKVGRQPNLTFAQMLTVFVAFQLSRKKDFKAFYDGSDGEIL